MSHHNWHTKFKHSGDMKVKASPYDAKLLIKSSLIITFLCGMTKGPPRHKETWWWNEEVAEAVRNKKIKYGKWKKENTRGFL